ncbi:hypothetical protein M9458_056919 [Cirrhinus mrigala]|uniref:Uncharacterized protein n=1 Tax=Cirrhinus mrigala TaxID=683832 RepID=A0ABD0MG88_CIRMR
MNILDDKGSVYLSLVVSTICRRFLTLFQSDCRKPVAEFINHVLALCHSNFFVDVVDSNLPPICKHTAAPAHHQPASSTCSSNELAPSGPPSLNPVLHSSFLILSPELAASSRTPAAVAASSRTPFSASSRTQASASSWIPATPPRSGLSAACMAGQINIKDNKDVCGLLSPVSPLVPSSSPKPPLIPSIPPECPPEPELPLEQCFPTLFLEAHQQCTFWMSPLSDQYISVPPPHSPQTTL